MIRGFFGEKMVFRGVIADNFHGFCENNKLYPLYEYGG
jgi:hypothetical protein